MPNTEVKLSSAENTWMVTSWEDREVLAFVYSPIAQSVERVTVNHDVVGSSPTWGAKKKSRSKDLLFLFVSEFVFAVNHTCNHDGVGEGGSRCAAD